MRVIEEIHKGCTTAAQPIKECATSYRKFSWAFFGDSPDGSVRSLAHLGATGRTLADSIASMTPFQLD